MESFKHNRIPSPYSELVQIFAELNLTQLYLQFSVCIGTKRDSDSFQAEHNIVKIGRLRYISEANEVNFCLCI